MYIFLSYLAVLMLQMSCFLGTFKVLLHWVWYGDESDTLGEKKGWIALFLLCWTFELQIVIANDETKIIIIFFF